LGFGLVPEGRKTTGLFLNLSVRENIMVTIIKKISRLTFVKKQEEKNVAQDYITKLAIKTPNMEQKIKFLSGGNQQKNIIARWLLTNPRVLFLDEPTHGIDVGAKTEIYKIIDKLAKKGVSVVIVSSELPEVISLADRVLVLRDGNLACEYEAL
jgi:ABC-type sugar transport system ATPase subunit